jgi:hypothetical protein
MRAFAVGARSLPGFADIKRAGFVSFALLDRDDEIGPREEVLGLEDDLFEGLPICLAKA